MIASLQQQGEMGVGRAGTDVKSPKIKALVACTTPGYDAVGGGEASLVLQSSQCFDGCLPVTRYDPRSSRASIVVSTVSFHLRVEIDVTRYEAYLIVGDGNPANDEETTVEVSVCTYVSLRTIWFF